MGIAKYKYYFAKPKSEIAKDILHWLLIAGVVSIAATSPYFIQNLLKANARLTKYKKRKVHDAFSSFKKRGLIEIHHNNHQIYISLTKEGKRKADLFQIDRLRISRPQRWDGKWRILIFDIPQEKKFYREAFRGKLKELGFALYQKSVWIHAFECRAEMELLRDFFGLSSSETCLIIAEKVENDAKLKQFFRV